MRPIEELLKNRTTARLGYQEPWTGKDADGSEVTVAVQISMTVDDCIKLYRAQVGEAADGLTDADLLTEFIIVHWATEVQS